MKKTRVLIVDDSALVRKLLSKILNSDRDIEVVGTAGDPYIARDKIKQLEPDVITLDVEMPRMDGLTFLSNLMRLHPLPVVMISSLTDKGAEVTLRALELGAIDFVSKPKLDLADALETYTEEIVEKVKIAARSKVRPLVDRTAKGCSVEPKNDADVILQRSARRSHFRTTETLIAIGASTGGTEAIKEVLSRLPPDAPGIVIAQHIPGAFSRPFAERVNQTSAMKVTEAEDGREILPGHAFIAPGSCHLLVERSGARFRCRLNDGPKVNRHKPSVDVLFRSVAENVGPNSIGVILTGMGEDGARGLREMRDSGSRTVAQDEASSVVWGMPGRAVELEAAEVVLPLGHIAGKLMGLTQG